MSKIKSHNNKLYYVDNDKTLSKVYLIQEIPGSSKGEPKYNILGAQKYGEIIDFVTRIFTNDFITWSFNP